MENSIDSKQEHEIYRRIVGNNIGMEEIPLLE